MGTITEYAPPSSVTESDVVIGGVPGIFWTPGSAGKSAPLLLLGHPGGLERMRSRLRSRAEQAALHGFRSIAMELPGSGTRDPLPDVDAARRELRDHIAREEVVPDGLIDRLILPLVDRAVPEWQAAIDDLCTNERGNAPVAISGGVVAIALRLAAIDIRVAAVSLFAGSFIPAASMVDARNVTIPVHMLLQWDDAGNDRQAALDLFDALGSAEKTLEANLGGHTGVPAHAGENVARFLARTLVL